MAESKFSARVDLDVAWVATQADLRSYEEDPRGYAPSFVPNIVSKNGIEVSVSVVPGKSGGEYQIMNGRNFMRVRFEGTFIEAFEMSSFPFDVQSLTFVFGISFFNATEIRFVRPPDKKSFFFLLTRYSAILEWTPIRLIAGIPVVEDFSTLVCSAQLKRDPGPYISRIGIPCLVLNFLQFAIFTTPEAFERVNMILTIILSYVALVYTLTTLVPMAARRTIADRYMFNSIAVSVITLFFGVLSTFVPDGEERPLLGSALGTSTVTTGDNIALGIAVLLQALMHTEVMYRVYTARHKEMAKVHMSFDEFYLEQSSGLPSMEF
jgi:hypothetical protein